MGIMKGTLITCLVETTHRGANRIKILKTMWLCFFEIFFCGSIPHCMCLRALNYMYYIPTKISTNNEKHKIF